VRAVDANGVLERSEVKTALLAALVESCDDAIVGENLDGQITFWNRGAERLFDFSAEGILGRSVFVLIPPEIARAEAELLKRASQGESIEQFETVRLRKDGLQVEVSITISPIRDAGGQIIGASEIIRDITERKNSERVLRRRNQELNAFLETALIGLHRVGPDGTILWANAAEMEMLGYRAEEYIGHHIAEFHADETAINEVLGTLGRGEKLYEYEARLRCKDGSIKYVVIDSSVLWEEGRFVHTQCFTRDITRRKKAEMELRESEERFRTLADNIAQFAWMADGQGSIFWYNKRWFEYTGTKLEEMQGWGWQKVHHPDHVGRVTEKIRRAFETGEYWEDTFPLRGKDGSYRWFLSRGVPIRDAEGKVVRWLGTNTDVTERMQMEAELAKAHEKLEHRARDLEAMVAERTAHLRATIAELEGVSYSLSHDMRAPLRTIQSFSEIVLAESGEKISPSGRELLQKSILAAERLDRLIRDVLIYSRVSRESIEFKTIDVENLVRQIIEERPEFQSPHAEIRIEGRLKAVRGHEAYMMQCITNLLDNAVKFVPPGRIPEVRIWSERIDGQVRLWIADNGIGIAKEAQERVFGIFQRVHAESTYPGTGIGLAIVRRAVERMGGTVGVESEPGRGSRFWVQLPAGE
jgi:PAS domain S-box-containing protein